MSDLTSPQPETTSPGAAHAPDSLEAAAASFQSLLFPKGAKGKPGEAPQPKPKATAPVEKTEPDASEEIEPEDEEVPEAEDATEATEQPVETVEEVESEDEQPEVTESEDEPATVKRSRKLKFSDGTEEDVSEDEAYQGYLRTKDYTVKSQANAELKRQLEAERQEARANAAQHAKELANVKAAMDRLVPKEPDWPELRKNLSAEDYANVRDEWTAFKAKRDEIEAKQKEISEQQAKDFEKDFAEWRKSEIEKLKAAVPEWVDVQRGSREVGEMAKYMLSAGYSQDEVDHSLDHRFLLMLRKAWLWDKAQSAGKTKVEPKAKAANGKIKSAPPGGKTTPTKPKSEEQRARDNLRKEGSIEAAASVFDNMLKRRPIRRH